MAGAGYRTFASGEVLTAANTQTYLMDQSITVFADATARDAAITSPTEGQYAYLKDTDGLTFHNGTAWGSFIAGKVLQVVSTTKTDTYTASVAASSFTGNVTGLSATITPVSTSSTILVRVTVVGALSTDVPTMSGRMLRGSTPIGVGATAGSRALVSGSSGQTSGNDNMASLTVETEDSPATTSATTYNFQVFNSLSGTRTVYVNRATADSDASDRMRTVSTITVMELAG